VDPVPGISTKTVEVGKLHGIGDVTIDFVTRTVAVTIEIGPRAGVKVVPFERVASFEIENFAAITDGDDKGEDSGESGTFERHIAGAHKRPRKRAARAGGRSGAA
jgi:hypothetical protein